MSGPQQPKAGDVVIHQRSPKTYTIRTASGSPQISCATLEEALERARSFANRAEVTVWFTTDDKEFKTLADI